MKNPSPSRKFRGFTIIEMTVALAMTLGIASTIVGMLQQQVAFVGLVSRFQFLRDEAPQINTLLTTIINKADSYRIYGSTSNAKAATGALQADGRALRLRFRNPDGTTSHAIIAFENQGGRNRLNYYFRAQNQSTWSSSPSWTISSRPALVDFSNTTGILLITMTGPNGEQITYAGNPN